VEVVIGPCGTLRRGGLSKPGPLPQQSRSQNRPPGSLQLPSMPRAVLCRSALSLRCSFPRHNGLSSAIVPLSQYATNTALPPARAHGAAPPAPHTVEAAPIASLPNPHLHSNSQDRSSPVPLAPLFCLHAPPQSAALSPRSVHIGVWAACIHSERLLLSPPTPRLALRTLIWTCLLVVR